MHILQSQNTKVLPECGKNLLVLDFLTQLNYFWW